MRILVTGGCGYIGNILVPKLLGLGHEVIALDIMWFGNKLPAAKGLTVLRDVDAGIPHNTRTMNKLEERHMAANMETTAMRVRREIRHAG